MKYFALILCLISFDDTKPRTALIPFANKISKHDIEVTMSNAWVTGISEAESDGHVIRIKLRTASMVEHLVLTHKCPRWVAEYYSTSPELLTRIHAGYELKFHVDQNKGYPRLQEPYLSEFKILKVTEPYESKRD